MRFLFGMVLVMSVWVELAQAQTVAYIRITVPKREAGHDFPMSVSLNGQPPIAIVSHEKGPNNPGWIPITLNHLSVKSDRTPIDVTPSANWPTKCTFTFTIEISVDNKVMQLTEFEAPSTRVAGYLPLGRGCSSKLLKYCSSVRDIQVAIVFEKQKELLKSFLNDVARIDNGHQNRIKHAQEAAFKEAKIVKQAPPPNTEAAKQVLEDYVKKWNEEYQRDAERAKGRFDIGEENPKTDLEKEFEKKFESEMENPAPTPEFNMSLANGAKAFDEGLKVVKEDYDAFVYDDIQTRSATQKDVRDQIRQEKNLEFARIQILRGQVFCHALEVAAKKGTSILRPEISRAMEIAEIVRGQELCKYGRKFTDEERSKKLCDLLSDFGLKKIGFTNVMDALEYEDKSVAKYIKKRAQDGLCGKAFEYLNNGN